MDEKPKMGEYRTIKAKAYRRRVVLERGTIPPEKAEYFDHTCQIHCDVWAIWCKRKFREPIRAMYIGQRTIQDGKLTYEGGDIGNVFWRERDHRVWLFVESENKNPIYVFPEDVENDAQA